MYDKVKFVTIIDLLMSLFFLLYLMFFSINSFSDTINKVVVSETNNSQEIINCNTIFKCKFNLRAKPMGKFLYLFVVFFHKKSTAKY